jgi:hypothetical protein
MDSDSDDGRRIVRSSDEISAIDCLVSEVLELCPLPTLSARLLGCSAKSPEKKHGKQDMLKRFIVLVIGVLATVAFSAAQPAVASTRASRCWSAKGTTITANSQVRTYYRGRSTQHTTYACYLKTAKVFKLGEAREDETFPSVMNVSVGGRFVGYQRLRCVGFDCEGSQARVLDTRSGKTRAAPAARTGFNGSPGLVVAEDGTVAYLSRFFSGDPNAGGTTSYEVHVFDRTGDEVIDSGPNVAEFSLAVVGTTLYWTNDGKAQSADIG